MSDKACEGSKTKSVREFGEHFEKCVHCKASVRHDLTKHHFFGFQNCIYKTQELEKAREK